MDIKTMEISGFAAALSALRLPYNKEPLSHYTTNIEFAEGEECDYLHTATILNVSREDIELASRLTLAGDSHAKPMRGIVVWADINAPLYFWSEIETYEAGHQRLFSASTQNTECKQLKGKALQDAKREISYGRDIRKIDFFSYQCLRNIVKQRHNHRVPEWHLFIEWIKTLPYAQDLILYGLGTEMRIHDAFYKEFKEEGCYE